MVRRRPLLAVLVFVIVATSAASCIHVFYNTDPPIESPTDTGSVNVTVPMRAHLANGGVAVFRDGATITPDTIIGPGWRYGLARLDSTRVGGVAMASVIGLESAPQSRLNAPATILVSAGGTALTAAAVPVLLVAIFGSCPTVYSGSGQSEALEAELFSYSVAPLLESRDVDALRGEAGAGVVRLDIRNEALETHFVNHLELLELHHAATEHAVPDGGGMPLAVSELVAPESAVDRTGRDLLSALSAPDDIAFRVSEGRLGQAASGDFEHAVELVFPRPRDAGRPDSVALVLRLRNSLLNTVLFYDLLLGSAGADALSWLGRDLQRIGPAVRLGGWWSSRMGLRVDVLEDSSWVEVGRLPDTGPIAWDEVAIPIPVPPGTNETAGDLRVRLRSVIDEWRIDRAALAWFTRRVEPTRHAPARVFDFRDATLAGGVQAVARPDEQYLESRPGDRYVVEFDVGPEPAGRARSFMLASQGYYTEWIRPEWVRQAAASAADPLPPGDAMLREAIRRWSMRRPALERDFFASRIPTR